MSGFGFGFEIFFDFNIPFLVFLVLLYNTTPVGATLYHSHACNEATS